MPLSNAIAIAPTRFAWQQARSRLALPAAMLVVLGLVLYGVFAGPSRSASETARGLAVYIACTLFVGSVVMAVVARALSLSWSSMMKRPAQPWQMALAPDGAIMLVARGVQVRIPAERIAQVRYFENLDPDPSGRLELCGMDIRLNRFGRILVPGSSDGFDDVRAALQASGSLDETSASRRG